MQEFPQEAQGGGNHARAWKWKVMSENLNKQTGGKKAVLVVLIRLARRAENKITEQIAAEIRKALEKDLARIPWLTVENVIIVEE